MLHDPLRRSHLAGSRRNIPHRFKIIPAQSTHVLVIASLPAINVTTASTASPVANGRSKLRVIAARTTSSSTPSVTTGANSAIQR